MAIQIIKRKRRPGLGDYALAGLQGISGGLEARRQRETDTLAAAKTLYEIEKLKQEALSYNQPVPEGFVRLPGGRIAYDPRYRNLPLPEEQAAYETAIEEGVTSEGQPINEEYRRRLAEAYGYEPHEEEVQAAQEPSRFLGFPIPGTGRKRVTETRYRKTLPPRAQIPPQAQITQGDFLPRDQYGFFIGQEVTGANGKTYHYVGNNQWEEL